MNHLLFKRTGLLLLFLGFFLFSLQSRAQYTATDFETGNYYTALAKDNNDNVYGTRYNTAISTWEVVKYTNGTGTPAVIYSGLTNPSTEVPWGLTVNSIGDVFVTNMVGQWQIIKLAAPTYTASVIQSGNYYAALGTDNSNNLLSMEFNSGTNSYQLVRYPFGAEQLAGSVVYNGLPLPTIPDDSYPWGIVTDQNNNIYLLDFLTHNNGQIIKLTAPAYTATTVATNRYFTALAKDASNNFYTIEGDPGNASQARIMKYTDLAAAGTQLYTGLSTRAYERPWGLAVTSNGTVYAGDYGGLPNTRLIKLTPPGVAVTSVNRVGAAATNTTTTVQYTVTFDGPASGVNVNSFSLTTSGSLTGVAIGSVSGSGTTYTVTVNVGTGEGTIRLNVRGTGITPTVTNVPFTGQVYTIDRTAPVTTLVSGPPSLTNSTTANFTFSSNEAGGTFEVSLDGGGYTAATSPMNFTGLGSGGHTFSVRAIDAAGNVDATPEPYSWTVDATAPNTSIVTKPTDPSSSTTATFTFIANEANCTFKGRLDGGPNNTVTTPLTFTGLSQGPHTFQVQAVDAAGNVDASPDGYLWVVDMIPTVTQVNVPINGYYKAGQILDFMIRFSENVFVTGTPYLPITIGSTTVPVNFSGGSGTNSLIFSYTVQPGDNDMDGIGVGTAIQLNGGTVRDASNDAVVTLSTVPSTANVFVNTVTPSVVLSTTASGLINTPFTVTATSSEAVTGLTVADFAVTNATVSNLSTTNNITYTVLVTPASDGPVTINLPVDVAINIGNNGNTASNTISTFYDSNPPGINSVTVPADGYYKAGDKLTFTINFNELVYVEGAPTNTPYLELQLASGTVRAYSVDGGPATSLQFDYTIVDGDMDMDGIVVNSLQLNGGRMHDPAGNNLVTTLVGVGNTSQVRVNTSIPSVSLSTTATSPVTTPFTMNIAFSENVTGFTSADIVATGATVSPVTVIDNAHYSVIVVPTGAGTISINVPADVAANIGGNGNSASNTITLTYDVTPPVVTSVSVPANGYYKAGNTLSFTVNFDENVVVTGTPSLPVTIGTSTVMANYTGGSGTNALTFAYTVIAGNNDMDGIATGTALQLNGGTIKDVATNDANLTLNSVGNTSGVFVNTTIPSVAIIGSAVLNAPWTATIVFSEKVTGFIAADILLSNASSSNFQTTDNITYTVLITPIAPGTVSITVPAGAAVNIGDNGNTASSPLTYTYDPNPSVITSVDLPATGIYKAGDVLTFTVNFDESVLVTGAPTLPVIIGSTTVQAAYVGGSGTNSLTFTYTVQDGDQDMDGISLGTDLQIGSAAIKDVSGNNATTTLNSVFGNVVKVNTTHATVVLSTAAARVNAAYTVTAAFSEEVTGLTLADFTATNATISNLQTTDNITYTIVVTPAADGNVSLNLPADAAVNVAGNGNKASNTLTVTMDATAPVITAAQNFNILQNSTAGTQIGQVLATDASGIIQNFAIASDPTGGAFAISATGMISVNDMAILNNNVGGAINLLVTVTDGLNTSTATAVAVKINGINKAPVLDAINNVTLCATTSSQTIQLTGASAVEPAQTYTLGIASSQAYFDVLSVNAAGLITYQLKSGVTSGVTTITVTIKDNGGTANGGVDTYQRTFTITVNPLPVVTIASDKGNSVSKGDVVHLTATGGATYNWTANSSIVSGQQDAVAEVRPQANTTYQVTAVSNMGCNNTASINIATIEDFKVDATNVLTPNGDGKNDKWVIRNIDSYPDNELKIFDRSGRLVFSQRNYNNNWDGKVNGNPLSEGTYYYFLSISGGAKTAKGFITIILKAN
ncbi:hypothetical protein A4H97_17475 [Niastella yeongjuensis]|uniref:Bacterial Ig-like domain-containing protein n=1 Tax=Niastella yeongjuensis TaxID=354355 RepID=A0A1V9E1J7_9BACT|nr:Ig-like domain-containing protein [Niastella yeongjuensis]OQP40008.1 hypothetical protein A4H97_17475 [Niastella yeongjuensis]SEO13384.1 gliding motility-associated C-terminal domain-containing protein [Niastella yeongjuensis]